MTSIENIDLMKLTIECLINEYKANNRGELTKLIQQSQDSGHASPSYFYFS